MAERTKEYFKGWYEQNHQRVIDNNRRWRDANRERVRKSYRVRRRAARIEAIEQYGGRCACCGQTTVEFLAIDHVNGGGRAQRQIAGRNLPAWLKRQGWPGGFRVLCHNCNQAMGYYGYCPHQAGVTNRNGEDLDCPDEATVWRLLGWVETPPEQRR